MDALERFLQERGLAKQETAKQHPVTRPDYTLRYEAKDITNDIAPYLISLSYTDYLEGQSDEVQVEFEDTDGRWLRGWYPEQGDALNLSLGDQFTGLVDLGRFEIAEIEYDHPPSTVRLKALATGITKANRTLHPKAYENTTLATIVRKVAARLKLSVTGTVLDIPIERVTQYQERDVEFLARLAKEYGHTFKIVGHQLVFTAKAELSAQAAVAVLLPEDMLRIRLRDLIKGVPTQVTVHGYDAKNKRTVGTTRKANRTVAMPSTAAAATRLKSSPTAAKAKRSSMSEPMPPCRTRKRNNVPAALHYSAMPYWWPVRLCSCKNWANSAVNT